MIIQIQETIISNNQTLKTIVGIKELMNMTYQFNNTIQNIKLFYKQKVYFLKHIMFKIDLIIYLLAYIINNIINKNT